MRLAERSDQKPQPEHGLRTERWSATPWCTGSARREHPTKGGGARKTGISLGSRVRKATRRGRTGYLTATGFGRRVSPSIAMPGWPFG